MEDPFRVLFIQAMRAKMDLCMIIAATLMEQLQLRELEAWDRIEIFRQWDNAVNEGETLAFALELLRVHERATAPVNLI